MNEQQQATQMRAGLIDRLERNAEWQPEKTFDPEVLRPGELFDILMQTKHQTAKGYADVLINYWESDRVPKDGWRCWRIWKRTTLENHIQVALGAAQRLAGDPETFRNPVAYMQVVSMTTNALCWIAHRLLWLTDEMNRGTFHNEPTKEEFRDKVQTLLLEGRNLRNLSKADLTFEEMLEVLPLFKREACPNLIESFRRIGRLGDAKRKTLCLPTHQNVSLELEFSEWKQLYDSLIHHLTALTFWTAKETREARKEEERIRENLERSGSLPNLPGEA